MKIVLAVLSVLLLAPVFAADVPAQPAASPVKSAAHRYGTAMAGTAETITALTTADLRARFAASFGPGNAGCVFELRTLVNVVPLERCVLVVDPTTDQAFLRNILQQVWHQSICIGFGFGILHLKLERDSGVEPELPPGGRRATIKIIYNFCFPSNSGFPGGRAGRFHRRLPSLQALFTAKLSKIK